MLADYVRQKILVAAVEAGVPTVTALLRRADEDRSGSLSYREFYKTLRVSLQLTAAAVTDDAIRKTFEFVDKTGDGDGPRGEMHVLCAPRRSRACS